MKLPNENSHQVFQNKEGEICKSRRGGALQSVVVVLHHSKAQTPNYVEVLLCLVHALSVDENTSTARNALLKVCTLRPELIQTPHRCYRLLAAKIPRL